MTQLPLAVTVGLFLVAGAAIWAAGTRLERLTDEIRDRTGIGGGLAGLVLLAAGTSMPELATTVTAVLRGSVDLAVANLLGGAAFQVVVLVIADAARRRGALTSSTSFGVLVESVAVLLLIAVAGAVLVLGDTAQSAVTVGGVAVGLNPLALALVPAYLAVLAVTRAAEGHPRWRPVQREEAGDEGAGEQPDRPGGPGEQHSDRRLGIAFALAAGVVLVAGWTAATTADAMAQQTGLGSALVGATLLAAATSLPEISTTVEATRQGHQDMAVSNVMGSNAFDVTLLALASVLAADAFPGDEADTAGFLAMLAAVLTCVYLLGLLLRSRRTVLGAGVDSVVVLGLYLSAVAVLYALT